MDTFVVFDVEDRLNASVCHGEAEASEIVSQFRHQASVRVHRITLGEFARDVTADFVSDEVEVVEYPAYDRACSAGDRAYQMAREVA